MDKKSAQPERQEPAAVKETTRLPFDRLCFSILPRLQYWMDGKPGKRTIFMTDEAKTVMVNFEEGMQYLDQKAADNFQHDEYRNEFRYLHQASVRGPEQTGTKDIVFFHMEIEDGGNCIYSLPGQMIVCGTHPKEKGANPLLIEILNSISILDEKQRDSNNRKGRM